jgi:IclR family transcriptional regulator, acetate operon repressor
VTIGDNLGMPQDAGPPIESVDRALQLVTLLRDEEAITVTHAAESLGVALSTAHRLLAALVYRGYAIRDSHRRYRAGPALTSARAQETDRLANLSTLARPAMELLAETTGETVELMVLRHECIKFVDAIESEEPLRVTARIGDLMPAHCTSGGKALLAELTDPELDELYRDGLPEWPTARITGLAQLKRELRKVRKTGFGTNFEETEKGVCSLGLAIGDVDDAPVASLVVAVPSVRFERGRVQEYVAVLQQAAAVAEAALGQPGSTHGP